MRSHVAAQAGQQELLARFHEIHPGQRAANRWTRRWIGRWRGEWIGERRHGEFLTLLSLYHEWDWIVPAPVRSRRPPSD